MIEETISKLEERLRSLPPEQRLEVAPLLAELRREAAQVSLQGRAAPEDDPVSAVRRLQEELAGFETSHPQLVGVVNRISTVLANMGL